jgi:hypothetical protein
MVYQCLDVKKVRLRGEEAIIIMRSLGVEPARSCSQAWKQHDFVFKRGSDTILLHRIYKPVFSHHHREL